MRDEGSARREPTGYKVRRAFARRQPRPSPRSIREKRTTCRLPLTGSAPYKGAGEEGAALMRRSASERAGLGVGWYQVRYLCLLAETHLRLRQTEAGLQ